jgi:hypothetical protein
MNKLLTVFSKQEKPDRKKRQRPKTWKDEWEKIIIGEIVIQRHV